MPAPQYSEIAPEQFFFREVVKNQNGAGRTIYVNMSESNKSNPRFQLEESIAKFGLQHPTPGSTEPTTRKNSDVSAASEGVRSWCRRMDEVVQNHLVNNSQAIFGKVIDGNKIRGAFRSTLSTPSKPEYAPLIRLKVNTDATAAKATNVMVFVRLKDNGEFVWRKGSADDITKNCRVLPIVEVSGVWLTPQGSGISLLLTDVLVYPTEQKKEFDFQLGNGITPMEVTAEDAICESEGAGEESTVANSVMTEE